MPQLPAQDRTGRSSSTSHRGCRLHYDVRGTGPVVLLIQGVGVNGTGWLPQTADLQTNWTCITLDNRGVGKSVPAGAAISTALMAEDAAAILDAEGVTAAHVIGHSLGGVVALELALRFPTRVNSLSLLSTFSGGATAAPLTPRLMWLGMRTRVGTRRMRRRAFLELVMPPGPIADVDIVAARIGALFGHDLAEQPAIAGAQLRALRASDTSNRLAELAGVPTLVMTGAHDPIAPPSAGLALSRGIPGARYVEVADASHGLPISHAALTNRHLRDHLGMKTRPDAAA
jgi:pimeloyl-ACP methyl ester carboxylesterase